MVDLAGSCRQAQMNYSAVIEHHADKVALLCKFIARNYGSRARFMVVIGEQGSGKHRALFSTLELMRKYEAYYNVVVFSENGEQQSFTCGDPNTCDKLWILFRKRADDVALTFQQQWKENKNYECLSARFYPDPTA